MFSPLFSLDDISLVFLCFDTKFYEINFSRLAPPVFKKRKEQHWCDYCEIYKPGDRIIVIESFLTGDSIKLERGNVLVVKDQASGGHIDTYPEDELVLAGVSIYPSNFHNIEPIHAVL